MEGNERKDIRKLIETGKWEQQRKQRQVPVSRQQARALTQTPEPSCHSEAGGDGDQTQPIFVETHGGNEALNHSRTQTQPDGEVRRLKSNTS